MNDNVFSDMEEAKVLATADRLIEELRQSEEEIKKYKSIADERIKLIKEQLEAKVDKLEQSITRNKFDLLQIANISKTKETKTQRKLELLAGDVIIKKPRLRYKRDNRKLLEAIKKTRPEFVRERVTESVDWATYKKELEIISSSEIVNKTTGEIVELEGLAVEEVPETVEVK